VIDVTEHIDDIKKELDEARRLKEELRRELEEARREKEQSRAEEHFREEAHPRSRTRRARAVRQDRPPRPVRPIHDVDIDLERITDSLSDMMDTLGTNIEASMRDGVRIPGIRITTGRKGRKSKRKPKYEDITPERVAKIVSPLGSEERLKILDFLKGGGQKFRDIEEFTDKTGSSLMHHLNPLIEAGYVVKGEVRGKYYVTVEGRLAYRLAQWLTHRIEQQRASNGRKKGSKKEQDGDVKVDFEEEEDEGEETELLDTTDISEAEEVEELHKDHNDRKDDDLDDFDWSN
jgi:DNA-binding transcriptional ArsR family regulator